MSGEVPFAVGTVYGLRSFALDRTTARLLGPTHGQYVFNSGENVARCGSNAGYTQPRHRVGSKGCSCGFYAYYNGRNTYYNHATIAAIIEGYGVVTYGSEGFRAEKCRIVAAVNPHLRESAKISANDADLEKWITNLAKPLQPVQTFERLGARCARFVLPIFATYVVSLIACSLFTYFWTDSDIWSIVSFVIWFVSGICLGAAMRWRNTYAQRRMRKRIQFEMIDQMLGYTTGGGLFPESVYALVAQHYPSIKWYPSTNTMLEDYPLKDLGGLPQTPSDVPALEITEGTGNFG